MSRESFNDEARRALWLPASTRSLHSGTGGLAAWGHKESGGTLWGWAPGSVVDKEVHALQAGPSSGIPSKATRGSKGAGVSVGTGWVRSCLRRSLALRKALGQWGQV